MVNTIDIDFTCWAAVRTDGGGREFVDAQTIRPSLFSARKAAEATPVAALDGRSLAITRYVQVRIALTGDAAEVR